MLMKKLRHILIIVILYMGAFELLAQNNPVSSGGVSQNNSGSISYSIGQLFYQPISGNVGSITPGIQQAYEITTSVVTEPEMIQLDLMAFPNPTTDFLYLKVDGNVNVELTYYLIDLNGQILEQGIATDATSIYVEKYAAGTYFLQIAEPENHLKTFRIIKN